MAIYEIPLTPEAQVFTITLAGIEYQFKLQWNNANLTWVFDLINSVTSEVILTGIPLVANTNLFRQYGYLNLGGSLVAQTDNNVNVPPNYDNLGNTGKVYFITNE